MAIDSTPIHQKAKQDYAKARRDLQRARQQLETFERRDQPQFAQWLSKHFGALLTQLRETDRLLREKRQLIYEVESAVIFERVSHACAYAQVMWRRQNPLPEAPPFGGNGTADHGPDEFSDAPNQAADSANPFADEFEEMFDELRETFEEFFGADGQPEGRSGKRPAAKPAPRRLKELYRALARKLHPDAQSEM